ncbi:Ig-like domain-containing protein, partial [Providencia rettgeri]
LIGGVFDPTDSTTKQDIVMNTPTPTFAGIAEPGTYLQLTVGQQVYKDIKVNEWGEWAFTLPNSLTDDEYNYQIEIIDIAGNLGTQPLIGKVTIDTMPPDIAEFGLDVSTNSGTLNDAVTNHSRPKFNGLTEPNALVEFTINKKTYQESTSEKGEWTVSMTEALSDGTHNYR